MTLPPTNRAAIEAQRAGKKTYTGTACFRCGGTERYVVTGSCQACVKSAVALRYQNKKAQKNAGAAAV